MAWQDTLVTMVRYLINDTTDPFKFEDSKIQDAILVSALLVRNEYPFKTSYTLDLTSQEILPDPTEPESYDPDAMALWTLKAACMLYTNLYQSAISTGIKVRDGDSEVDTTGGLKGYADILKNGPCSAYKELLKTMLTTRGMNQGKAILSPYSSGS